MPVIREYRSQTQVAGPIGGRRATAADLGGNALTGAGEGLMRVADAMQRRHEQAEISDLNAKMAETQAQWSVQLQETLRTAQPGDPEISDRFLTGFDEYTAKIGESIETDAGREYFNRQTAALRGHFTEAAFKGQAVLAGVKATQDYNTALNGYSSALVNDPSAFDMSLALHDEGLDNLVASGLMSRASAQEQKTKGATALAKSAVRGWVAVDPQFAKEQLDDGRWDTFLGGDLKVQMLGEAKQAIRAEEVDAERRRVAQERAFKEAQIETQNEFLAGVVSGDLTAEDILNSNLDPFGSGSKEQFLGLLETANKKGADIKTDAAVYVSLFDRIHLPDGDPQKLTDENDLNQFVGRGLTFEDLNELRGEIQGGRTREGSMESTLKKGVVDVAKSMLTDANPLLGIKDPKGEEQLQKFMTFFLQEYPKQRAAGKSMVDLLNPDSPDYLGKAIQQFRRTPIQQFKDLMEFNPGLDLDAPEEGATGPDVPLGDIPNRAAQTATGANGEKIYLVDGKWVHADGSEVQ